MKAKDRGIAIVREACGHAGATSKTLQRVAAMHAFTLPGVLNAGKGAGLLRYDNLHARWYAADPVNQEKPARRRPRDQQPPADPPPRHAPELALELPASAPVRAEVITTGEDPLVEITVIGFQPVGDDKFAIRRHSVRVTVSQIERVLAWARNQQT